MVVAAPSVCVCWLVQALARLRPVVRAASWVEFNLRIRGTGDSAKAASALSVVKQLVA